MLLSLPFAVYMDDSESQLSGVDTSTALAGRRDATTDLAPSGTVTLNVGGKLYTTLYETLQKDSKSLLAQLVVEGGHRDAQGHLFIDRDPQHFGLILNYLRDKFAVLPRDEAALREIMIEAAYYKLEGLKDTLTPHGAWRPNFATHMRASTMHQLRGDKLAMKGALDLILFCAFGDQGRGWPGAVSRVDVAVYDFAEHAGDSLAFTPPTVPVGALQSSCEAGAGQLMYTRVKQSALFRGDANSRWFETVHELRHRMMGEAPHLMDPERMEAESLLEDGRQRGLYETPCAGSGAGRSPASTAEFTDSIFEVHRRCTGSLPREERELRDSALYIIQNLQMLTLALRLCDFKDVAVAVESKHVPDEERDKAKAGTDYPTLVLYDVRLAISLTL